jgi:hypothetical protein
MVILPAEFLQVSERPHSADRLSGGKRRTRRTQGTPDDQRMTYGISTVGLPWDNYGINLGLLWDKH